MLWWQTRFSKWNGGKIEPVEIERETPSCIWINGRKNNKRSEYLNFFPTWEEAQAWLMAESEADLVEARHDLARAQALHGNIKGMKRPPALS